MSEQQTWSFQNRSLQKSFFWSLAITVLPVASGFVVSWVIARWGGPRMIGIVSWVMSFATAALILAKFGLDVASSRLASEYGVQNPGYLRRLFKAGITFRAVFTVAVSGLILGFAKPLAAFFGDPTLVGAIRIAALVVVCASFYEFQENFLVGLNRLGTVYKIRSTHLISRITFTIAMVFLGAGATTILGGYCAAWLIAIVAYALLLHRSLPAGPGSSPEGLTRRLLVLSGTLAISGASVAIFSHMDRLMLGYFSGVEEVGQYAVARNIAEVSLFPVFAIIMMLRPALASRYSTGDVVECSRIIRKSLRFSLVSGVLFAAIFAVLGVPLVTFVFSENFRYSGELMIFFIWIIAFRSIGSVILPALIAAERTKAYAYLTALSAAINFVLNLVLIPRFQSKGAIVATIVSYGVLMLIGLRQVVTTYQVKVGIRAISLGLRTVLAGVLSAGLISWLFDRSGPEWGILLWAVLLTALYLALIFVFRVGSVGDLRRLLNLRYSRG